MANVGLQNGERQTSFLVCEMAKIFIAVCEMAKYCFGQGDLAHEKRPFA
jgi:hypothetical protein